MSAAKRETEDRIDVRTKVLPCTCSHRAQDEMYGKGKRVMNWAKKASGWRCTVCGRISNG